MNKGLLVEGSDVLRSRFGRRIEGLLAIHGLSVAELAIRAALPAKRLDALIAGRPVRLTLSEMAHIASILGTPLYDLLAPIMVSDQSDTTGAAGDDTTDRK